MITRIYFIRHGEVYNPKNLLYGRLPRFPLSDKGRLQIEKIGKELKKENITHIYYSPMLRTWETAKILGSIFHLIPKRSINLIETNDIHRGMPVDRFRKEIEPHLYSSTYISYGQESIESQEERMLKFINRVLKRHQGENIIAVTHGDPIMIVRAKIEGVDFTYQYKKSHFIQKGDYFILEIKGTNIFNWLK